ncbi:VOC family protein [Kiloniella laminariae]|uniref:VOC family protein n=1 Tax=Kiloniella laminariae TaxID=454162 RepID=UPI0012FAEFD4|nr:VOC family protein [Kiloniella laminariae]
MIAEFEKVVVDVTNLEEGLTFWSKLTGLERSLKDPAGRFHGLGIKTVQGEENSVILLQLVDEVKPGGGTHIDLRVKNVEIAVEQVLKIGGKLRKKPDFYPNKSSAFLEWAVMQDPYGNPFCLIRTQLE